MSKKIIKLLYRNKYKYMGSYIFIFFFTFPFTNIRLNGLFFLICLTWMGIRIVRFFDLSD